MVAVNGASIANIGVVSFAGVTLAQLETLSYGVTPIDGSDASNVLVPGDVFAIRTNASNFAKALVTGAFDLGSDHGLPIQWETDAASVPEPGSFFLGLTGIAAFLLVRRSLAKS